MNDKVRQYIADLRGTSLHPLMEEVLKLAERAIELETFIAGGRWNDYRALLDHGGALEDHDRKVRAEEHKSLLRRILSISRTVRWHPEVLEISREELVRLAEQAEKE